MKIVLIFVVISFCSFLVFRYLSERKITKDLDSKKALKVKVLASGVILADEKPVTLEALESLLVVLKKEDGVVWYYRELGAENPSEEVVINVQKVLDLVTDNNLPITLSTKPDFSDYVDGKGQSHPRGR